METKEKSILREAVIGSIIFVVIMVVGTIWMGRSASEDTEKAVSSVSLLYLDELAGRREQVVASALNDYIADMDIALGLMTKNDLSSIENLQAYQTRMKQLYGLEKFAFVDNEGLIYTSRGTRTDISQYKFDYTNLTEPEISLKNMKGNNKKLVIAVPVDNLQFQGKTLVVCFMELSMAKMLENVSLTSNNNSTTFCNVYSSDGVSLASVILGGLSSDDNVLRAMETVTFEKGYSLEKVKKDFAEGRKGVVSFTYDDVKVTVDYVPVHGTDWMLTYLIRESVIGEQISSITEGIIFRNSIQSILAALVLIVLFSTVIMQIRKNAKMTLERETTETENRVKQQELEEQLALQEELLAQEQHRAQQDSMIKALSSNYRSVYYVNLDSNECVCFRKSWEILGSSEEGDHFPFLERFQRYADTYVTDEYRENFLKFIEPATIRNALANDPVISYSYLIKRDGKESYEMLRMANAGKKFSDENVSLVGIAFADIDAEMRDSMAKNQALNDALKTAEEASKAKTVFLSSMSHEIRTPMNAIIGLNSLALHEKGISDTTKGYLEKIGSSAQHLLNLINDILDMSRIESGRMTVKSEEFAFSKLLEQINTMIGGQCQEKELHYNCRVNGQLDDFYIGDSMKLKQVLINILGNAVKFTPKGGNVDLIVEKTAAFDGKSTIQFKIKDTGVGMSKEYLPKIFDAFSQENSGNTNKYGSTGLGMAITKSIVDMMNGTISVESEKNVGTTFTVAITLVDSKNKVTPNKDSVEISPQEMSVLVVDDDPIACDHAKLVLKKIGIEADAVNSGEQALEMIKLRHARRELYNLIIVDWQMPGMNGVELTKKIREVIGDETAIIILTAYNWDDIAEDALSAGVDSFISKPLFSGSLIDEFKSALQKKKFSKNIRKGKVDLKGKKILLAEDMPVNAEIMIMVLQMRDVEVDHAENGKMAVEMFSEKPSGYYSAILMDMRMPEMDGLEATQAIRALDRDDAKKIPIIALTANAFDEDVQRSLQAGLNAHLSKPVEPELLFETLENFISD